MAYDPRYLTVVNVDTSKNGTRFFSLRTEDAVAAVQAAGYVSNGRDRGMRFGDRVSVQRVTAGTLDAPTAIQTRDMYVAAVNTAGAATVGNLVAMT